MGVPITKLVEEVTQENDAPLWIRAEVKLEYVYKDQKGKTKTTNKHRI